MTFQTLLDKRLPAPKGKVEKWNAKLEVKARALTATFENRKLFEHKWENGSSGQFSLIMTDEGQSQASIGRIVLSGTIGPGWIGGLIDASLGEQRKAFDAAWKEPSVFGAWGPGGAENTELTRERLMRELRFEFKYAPEHGKLLTSCMEVIGKSRAHTLGVLEHLDKLPEGLREEPFARFLRFNCALDLEHHAVALEQLEHLQVAPEQVRLKALFGAVLHRVAGQIETATALLEALAADDSGPALVHDELATCLLLTGKPDAAHAAILRGLEQSPSSALLAEAEAKVVKAAKGPQWKRRIEERSERFVVVCESTRELARSARVVLDEAWLRCADFFGPLPAGTLDPTTVYLFEGQASYLAYVKGVADDSHENTLGLYAPVWKQIVVWNHPDQNVWRDVLRHECAHRYLDLRFGLRIPRWLNEGMADAFAASWKRSGEFAPGQLRQEYLAEFLLGVELAALGDFVRQSPDAFMADVDRNYAYAWTVVHYLQFVDKDAKPVLERLLQRLDAGDEPALAIDAALESVDLKLLQTSYLAWLNRVTTELRIGEAEVKPTTPGSSPKPKR